MAATQGAAPDVDPATAYPFEDLMAALLFMVIGIGAFVIALDYPTGTLRRMGPGVFPLLVSGLMIAIGAALALQTLLSGRLKSIPSIRPKFETVRALFFVMASLLAFALLVRPAGLFIATAVQVFIATRAEPGRALIGSIILSLSLAVIAAVIFVYGVGLHIPLWP
jgi:hypothetical protein